LPQKRPIAAGGYPLRRYPLPDHRGSTNQFIEQQLDERLKELETAFTAHALCFYGPIYFGVDDFIRSAVEARVKIKPESDRMIVVVTTDGGYIEVVQRIVAVLRKHYKLVDFVVPNYAFSAGTVLVMSGDSIYMDYYSRLGPIDPQVQTQQGKFVPALGYLERYNALVKKAAKGKISTAEAQLIIDGFDQAELYKYEQARDLSVNLLEDWLVRYKFKDWKVTKTRKKNVTAKMKTDAASHVGKTLNDTKKWHSHGHGISKEILDRDLHLLIDDFGANLKISQAISAYHDLLSDYMLKSRMEGIVHYAGRFQAYMYR
jgi:Serine dehydrogenase proteinase